MVQWLRLHAPNAGSPGLIPGRASLVAQTVKNLPAMLESWVQCLGWENPWRRAWQPTPVFLPGESPRTVEAGGLQSMGLPSQT